MKPASVFAAAGMAVALLSTPALAQANGNGDRMLDQRVQQHITQLHQELGITPAQQQQWDQFARTMWQNAHQMHDVLQQRAERIGSMNALEDMQSYAQLSEVHAQDMQRLSSTFRSLYESMSPRQQQNATQIFRQEAERFAARHRNEG